MNLSDLKAEFRADIAHFNKSIPEMRKAYEYYSGHQWDAEDIAELQERNRPVLVFNRIGPMVAAVVGSEINNPQEIRFIQREQGDAKSNELLTGAGMWYRDEAQAEFEESHMFSDTAICGIGWVEENLDYDSDPDGRPQMDRLSPFEVFADRFSYKNNCQDSRRRWRYRFMTIEDARDMFPDDSVEDLDAGWAKGFIRGADGAVDREDDPYVPNSSGSEFDGEPGDETSNSPRDVLIIECQYYETEIVMRVVDPMTGKASMMPKERYKTAVKEGLIPPDAPALQQRIRKYKRVFIGRKILGEPDQPITGNCFSYHAVTCFRDEVKKQWYGIVRAMMDPQEWSNKWLSQTMHILNANAKGGMIAEIDVTDDVDQFEQSYSSTDEITWVRPGALSEKKLQEKRDSPFPSGFFELVNFAVRAVREVSGINLEMLGMREAQQAGVLEYQRRQAGMTVLAHLFNNFRLYRREQGKAMLYIIQNYLSDGRLIRILGEDSAQYIQLVRQADAKFDIILDDAPTAPNQKERTWQLVQNVLPMVANLNPPPEFWTEVIKFAPIPSSMAEKLVAVLQKGGEPDQYQEMLKALNVEEVKSRIDENRSQAEANKARAAEDTMDAAETRMQMGLSYSIPPAGANPAANSVGR
jgi:hypothetical protein